MRHTTAILLLLVITLLSGLHLQAQSDSSLVAPRVSKSDSVKVSQHSPTTAMLLSIIPGGGQIYNHKAWKLPIIYGLMGGSSYLIYYFGHKMTLARNEYINRRDGNYDLLLQEFANTDNDNLLALKNKNLRNMELAIGATLILYTLNIIDAMVDAHLYYFDVSDDLSLQWSPAMMPSYASNQPAFGLTLQLRW